ncbi:MAG: hypothetical protein Q9180_003956 [Flavoplaca navasiana]
MSKSMKWFEWSGFTGPGTYVIFNKESLTCLDLENGSSKPDTKVQGLLVNEDGKKASKLTCSSAHSPNNWAQVWLIRKQGAADLYSIECKESTTILTASGPDKPVVGRPKGERNPISGHNVPTEGLWAIDKSMYGLEPGKMVVFRNVKYPGYVLDLHHGEKQCGTPVNIIQERGLSDKREMQKWLLQIQP